LISPRTRATRPEKSANKVFEENQSFLVPTLKKLLTTDSVGAQESMLVLIGNLGGFSFISFTFLYFLFLLFIFLLNVGLLKENFY